MRADVPLVVPEANAADVKKHKGIIANPNCSTIQMVVALAPIKKKAGLKRIIVSTYQAVSGSGRGGIVQMEEECRAWAEQSGKDVFKHMDQRIAFNIFPHIGSFNDDGYTTEEMKLVNETRKILHDSKIKISATVARVPVKTGHSEAVYIETAKPISPEKVRELLKKSPGFVFWMTRKIKSTRCLLIRKAKMMSSSGASAATRRSKTAFWLWVVADNLRKGAATNAVQIAEELIKVNALRK